MPKVTIICPTFDHQDTLYPVMESIKRQTFQDFEVVVIGDGSPLRTAEIMADICDNDPRFHYRLFPKSERTGEPYRDIIIRESQSDIIAYICDDDLWLPWHLEWMVTALQTADFAHSMHHNVHLDGHIDSMLFQFNSQRLRQRIVSGETIRMFGLTYASHTRKAYLDLPHGWETTPKGMATDKNMWLKFTMVPTLSFWTCGYPTALHFTAKDRDQSDPTKRAEELWEHLESFSNNDYALNLLERVSFLPYVSNNLCKKAPKYLSSIQQLFEFYDIQIQELSEPILLTTCPNSNVLYFRPQSMRLLDIYWKYLNGSIDEQTTKQLLEQYLEVQPWNNDARMCLSRLYMNSKHFEKAEKLLNYLDINIVPERYSLLLGIILIKQGKFIDTQRIIDVLQERKTDVSQLISMIKESQMDNISIPQGKV